MARFRVGFAAAARRFGWQVGQKKVERCACTIRTISVVRHEQQTYEALVQEPQNAQVLSQSAALNRIFDEKAFSWTLAMEDLETVLPGGVQVTTLEPIRDKKDGHITLRMRVVGPRDKAVELVQNLERSRHFLLPRITGESAESQGNGANPALEPISMSKSKRCLRDWI